MISETAKARDSETIQDEEPISAAPVDRVPSDGQTPCIGEETEVEETVVAKTVPLRKYKGWVYITESETKVNSSDSDDDVPLASLLKDKTVTSPYLEELQDYKQGPEGQRAVGKTVAKMFDGCEFTGKVDSFRQVRRRFYYHVTYTDGDDTCLPIKTRFRLSGRHYKNRRK